MDCLECNIIQVKLDVDAKDASPAVAGTSASHPLKYRFELKWQKVHGLISRFYNVQYPFKLDRLMPAYMQPPKLPTAKQVALLHTWHQLAKSNPGHSIRELVALWSSWCTLAGTLYVLAPAHEPLWDSFVQGTWRSCPTTEVEEGQGLISRTTTKKCPQGEAGCSLFSLFLVSPKHTEQTRIRLKHETLDVQVHGPLVFVARFPALQHGLSPTCNSRHLLFRMSTPHSSSITEYYPLS